MAVNISKLYSEFPFKPLPQDMNQHEQDLSGTGRIKPFVQTEFCCRYSKVRALHVPTTLEHRQSLFKGSYLTRYLQELRKKIKCMGKSEYGGRKLPMIFSMSSARRDYTQHPDRTHSKATAANSHTNTKPNQIRRYLSPSNQSLAMTTSQFSLT